MTLLLLRGPQTPGELRTRSERMHHFDSVQEVDTALEQLASGFDAMVCELPRQPGQRETRWAHLEGTEDPREAVESHAAEPPASKGDRPERHAPSRSTPSPSNADRERLETLEEAVRGLQETVAALAEQLRDLQEQLGVD